jgi:hypothetical protein
MLNAVRVTYSRGIFRYRSPSKENKRRYEGLRSVNKSSEDAAHMRVKVTEQIASKVNFQSLFHTLTRV